MQSARKQILHGTFVRNVLSISVPPVISRAAEFVFIKASSLTDYARCDEASRKNNHLICTDLAKPEATARAAA